MIYRVCFYLANAVIRVFFRKIYVNGLSNIKPGKSYMITSNHPGGFIEPIIMACTFPIDLYFMVRGDLFKNRYLRYFLESTHQIPIFRSKDGFSNLRNNQSSIEQAVDTLANNKALMVFAEGSTEYIFSLRPLQKGFVRMGFQTLEAHPTAEIEILPIGVNFNYLHKMGSDVIINVGEPISLNSYFATDAPGQAKGTRQALQDTYNAMSKLVLHATTSQSVTELRSVWAKLTSKDDAYSPKIIKDSPLFDQLYARFNPSLDGASDKSVDTLTAFGDQDDASFKINGTRKSNAWLWWVLAIPSFVFTAIPRYLMHHFTTKVVTKLQFKTAVAVPVILFSSLFLVILTFIIGWIWVGLSKTLLLLGVLTVSGYVHAMVWENSKKA